MKPHLKPILWENRNLHIIDQTLLPGALNHIPITTLQEAEDAIKLLKIRGAPALGIFAGFALLAIVIHEKPKNVSEAIQIINHSADVIKKTRPTAVNLFWATDSEGRVERFQKKYARKASPKTQSN